MILKKLSLANFRGFEQLDITFDSRRTVIVGVNGIGKSGILRAVSVALSRLLPQMSDCTEDAGSFTDDDVHSGKSQLDVSAVFAVAKQRIHVQGTRRLFDLEERAKLRTKLDDLKAKIADARKDKQAVALRRLVREQQGLETLINEDPERWVPLLESETEQGSDGEASGEVKSFLSGLRARAAHPIVVYFTTSRYQKSIKLKSLPEPAQFEKSAAYNGAFDEEAKSFRYFLHWFRSQQELKGVGLKRRQALLSALADAAGGFVEGLSNFRLETEPTIRFLADKGGVTLSLNQLSDGERGVLAMVFDIARRLAIANPDSADPIREGKGIVLIDEIELHLHPVWQRTILRKLGKTFPKCQFIVTSHSPQVVGQCKSEQLRVLKAKKRRVRVMQYSQSFGMDSNWVLEEIMGTPSRDHAIELRLKAIADAVDDDELVNARKLTNQLEQEVGLFPALQEWISTLDRLEMLDSDETD